MPPDATLFVMGVKVCQFVPKMKQLRLSKRIGQSNLLDRIKALRA
jgi:hypothetical protein